MSRLETIADGFGLLEGPVWDDERGLLVADAIVGGVYAIKPGEPKTQVVAHRRGIGGMTLHADGGIVIGGRNIAVKRFPEEADDSTHVLLENDPQGGIVGYNDLTTDRAGRIYVGSLAFVASDASAREGKPPAGRLHVIDLDGSSRAVGHDVALTNGLGFSPDGARLYHSDSLRHAVFVYPVLDNGDLGPKALFANVGAGHPDGLAVDANGTVWVALAMDSRVAGYAPDGREIASIPVPVPMVTSICFGGKDLRDLYIVTGSEGQSTERGGNIYRVRAEVPGLPKHPARVTYDRG